MIEMAERKEPVKYNPIENMSLEDIALKLENLAVAIHLESKQIEEELWFEVEEGDNYDMEVQAHMENLSISIETTCMKIMHLNARFGELLKVWNKMETTCPW